MNKEKLTKLTAVFLATLPISVIINVYAPVLRFFALSIFYLVIYLPYSALTGNPSPPLMGIMFAAAYLFSVIFTSLFFAFLASFIIDPRQPTLKHLTTG